MKPFFSGFTGVFLGGFGKTGVLLWCLDGEIVVECVVNVVKKMALNRARKTRHILQIYFSGSVPRLCSGAILND